MPTGGQTGIQMDEWTDELMDGWTDEQTNKSLISKDFAGLGVGVGVSYFTIVNNKLNFESISSKPSKFFLDGQFSIF